ncbi:MAG: hypothetical protein J3Q66DRAFT_180274 [Benniella sp.]|nr:MAG: hypothetical protein J3Q66DRAFT_180274 [Benniella sp.]
MSIRDLAAFLKWADKNGIQWDKDAIEVREGKHGLGVFAKKDLDAGQEVIRVPKSAVLSTQNSGIATLLEDADIEGYIALTLACMFERSRGSQSPWAEYLILLNNRRPLMANSLPDDAYELLKRSEAYGDIETDLKDLQEDYDTIIVPFLRANPSVFTEAIQARFFTLEDFKVMTNHVASRGMDVDNFHEEALVPFADLVNHNSDPNADYLSHEDVCEVCGALSCEHMEEEEDSEGDEDDDDAPQGNSRRRHGASKNADEDEDDDEDEEEDEDDWEDDDTCDVVLDRDVMKGEEITRHYGPYPNKILLSKFGFADINNEHNTVSIQLDMVKKAVEGAIGDAALIEERVQWFLDTEDIFIDEDEDEDEESDDKDKQEKQTTAGGAKENQDEEEEGEATTKNDDLPRDVMYMLHNGSIDDRLLMLLNVIFMEKEQFAKVQESMELAAEYFNDIFRRRAKEEGIPDEEEEDEDDEDELKIEIKPLDEAGRQIRRCVLEATLQVIRLRADAYGVSEKTTAEEDLETLKKSGLTGLMYYGHVCAQGEKQILQNGLKLYGQFLAEL